jgi:hypothetical protein
VPHPHAPGAQQRRRQPGDAWIESQGPHVRKILPEVLALDERLFVGCLLRQRPLIVALAPLDRRVDRRPIAGDLLWRENRGDMDEAVAVKGRDQLVEIGPIQH